MEVNIPLAGLAMDLRILQGGSSRAHEMRKDQRHDMDEHATHDQMQRREKKDQRPAEANESEIQIGGTFFG